MYAKITKDHLFEPDPGDETLDKNSQLPSRAGWQLTTDGVDKAVGKIYRVKLLDDDRILYYEGEGDDEALEGMYNWAERDAGCTILQIFNTVKEEWEDCIG